MTIDPNMNIDEDRPDAIAVVDALAGLPADFLEDGREDSPPQERDDLSGTQFSLPNRIDAHSYDFSSPSTTNPNPESRRT
ncbi:hypothetical protein [Sphaerotilus mobilis]|uniref:Uncharacterized protein n=1 Tax=Sphaerotilus mobilis TaxID=47994 RepID=A0A4Q7LUV8_9BURK|nr:hypothetical protein [Sphaerotilus mobilis]RZS58371.1 hypothetical protein EV685_0663 [Sphaerotilus mobilis]